MNVALATPAHDASKLIAEHTSSLPSKLIFLAVVCVVAISAQRILVHFAKKTFGSAKAPSASIFLNLTRFFIWAIALLAVLEPVFGVRPTAFVTALGVTSLVLSLGMQDSISNIIGGLALTISHVVTPGDVVKVSGISGEVLDITWRSTTVRDTTGNVQVIPNSVLNKTALTHLAPGTLYQITIPLSVNKTSDLKEVEKDVVTTVSTTLEGKLSDGKHENADSVSVPGVGPAHKLTIGSPSPEDLTSSNIKKDGPIQLRFTGITATAVSCDLIIYLQEGVDVVSATDAVVRALCEKSWLN